jgi:hypothetical protein
MARNPNRLRDASSALLTEAAIIVARAVVLAPDQRGRNQQLRAETMMMLDHAGLAIVLAIPRPRA